ncbi:MAG: sulfatase-like hydrolase/transferase [Nocardioidaceae bacterium]
MSHVLPPEAANDRRPSVGTNASIEQPFAPMAAQHRPPRPNLLVIDACDLGVAELGAYGGAHADTPATDRLALSGVRFTEAHTPVGHALGGHDLMQALGDHGYSADTFGAAERVDLEIDVESAVEFIGLHRAVPWAAYVRLHARPAPQEPLPSVLSYVNAVAGVDASIGRMVTSLRRSEQYRSTLVLVVGASEGERLVFDRVHQPDAVRARADWMRVPTLLSWPGQIPPRQRHDDVVLTADWMPTLLSFAQVRPGETGGAGAVDLSGHLLSGGGVPARDEQIRAA